MRVKLGWWEELNELGKLKHERANEWVYVLYYYLTSVALLSRAYDY